MDLTNLENLQQESAEEQNTQQAAQVPDKSAYMQRILALSPEDKAFMEGYLYALVTSRNEKGA